MKAKTLEGRMKYKHDEAIQLLKKEAKYLTFCEERGFIYEMNKAVYGTLTKIVLALKNGHISVLEMNQLKTNKAEGK